MGKILFVGFLTGTTIIAVSMAIFTHTMAETESRNLDEKQFSPTRISVAVLGDSDSHIYRDSINNVRRGGAYHDLTFQWTEIWDRLRQDEVNQGPLGVWGTRYSMARIRSLFGLEARVWKKYDYRFNYAKSGAGYASLYESYPFQAQSFLSLLKKQTETGNSMLVFIRIGINDFGQLYHLQKWAKTELIEERPPTVVDSCLKEIRRVVSDIFKVSDKCLIALVGTSHDYNTIPEPHPSFSHIERKRALSVLNHFESALHSIAENSDRIAYIDGFTHFNRRWGNRFKNTLTVEAEFTGSQPILNLVGDEPFNRTLADGHASTINNGLWLQYAIEKLNEQLGLGLTPILDDEIADIADPDCTFGIARSKAVSNIPPKFILQHSEISIAQTDLPYMLPIVSAESSEGIDVSNSLIAFVESANSDKNWAYGSGNKIFLKSQRHQPGRYKLVYRVHDRYRNQSFFELPLIITP